MGQKESAIFGKSKISYRKCKKCGETAIVNPDKTLRQHGQHTTYSAYYGGYTTSYCLGK